MDWSSMADAILDKSQKEVNDLRCLECNGPIYINYNKKYDSLVYGCKACGRRCSALGTGTPVFITEQGKADGQFQSGI